MFKRPNFYLLCIVKVPEWSRRIIIPVPLFLVDEILDIGAVVVRLISNKHLPKHLNDKQVTAIYETIRLAWREIRGAGSFTLADVNAEGTKVSIRLV